jgi:hypothetical protein
MFGLPRHRASRRPPTTTITLALAAVSTLAMSGAQAAPKRRAAHGSKSSPATRTNSSGPSRGKVAVFAFDGDESTNVRKHVVLALKDRGLQVDVSLRPAKTDEEFRDMGATLNLAAYVHGTIKDLSADHAEATIVVRSGVTGRTIAATTIKGFRRGLRFDVEEKLWGRVGKSIMRVCKEAKKPRRPRNEPLRIEAGTPL